MATQNDRLLGWLKSQDGISTLEAMQHLRICRLSERIRELEKRGYTFTRTTERSNNATFVRYRLAASQPISPVPSLTVVEGQRLYKPYH